MVDEQSNVENWTPISHNLGTIPWHDEYTVIFEYKGTKTIAAVQSSCPCVQVSFAVEDDVKLQATWKPKKPDAGFTVSTKAITIKYLDKTREQLYLTATIV